MLTYIKSPLIIVSGIKRVMMFASCALHRVRVPVVWSTVRVLLSKLKSIASQDAAVIQC